MSSNVNIWLHGLIAALVSGGASAVTAGITISAIDPAHFNFGHDIFITLKLMSALFITSGLLGAFGYLKQSPVPPPDSK